MAERSENSGYIEKLAVFGGIEPDEVDLQRLDDNYSSIKEGIFEPYFFEQYVNPSLHYYDHRRYTERMNQLVQLTEGALDLEPGFVSYGLFSPSYLSVLFEQEDRDQTADPHLALLVGAMTENTVSEFGETLRSVFESVTPFIIDIEGQETAEASKGSAHFVLADGLLQPFKPGSIDSIHTNVLLQHLESDEVSEEARLKFFNECFKSLKEGGKLILLERDPEPGTDEFKSIVTLDLEEVGYTDVNILPALRYSRRKYRDQHFAGEALPDGAIQEEKLMKLIVATK